MSDDGQEARASDLAERIQRALAQGGMTAVGYRAGGLPGAVAGASIEPFVESMLAKVWGELRGDTQQRQGEALAAAQEALGVDPEELEQQILASDVSRLQAGAALSAATCTTWPPKIRALGRALAAGLIAADDTRIDTQPLIMAALAEIEFPHASLLELLVCHWPRITDGAVVAEWFVQPADSQWTVGQRIWTPSDIVVARPMLRPVLPSLLGTLSRHGLAAQSDEPGDPFGRTGRTMQQRFIGDQASRPSVNLGAISGYAPAGSWLPTELGQEVIGALLEAGAEFGE